MSQVQAPKYLFPDLRPGPAIAMVEDNSVFRTEDGLAIVCPYCLGVAKIVSGDCIYPHRSEFKSNLFYLCKPCHAWVGVHKETSLPLGRLADAALRHWRRKAHLAFDPLWEGEIAHLPIRTRMKARNSVRNRWYKWLAERMSIDRDDAHIGMFDIPKCKQVVEICERYQKSEAAA